VGAANGTTTISGISSTADLAVGMRLAGDGVPVGCRIEAVGPSWITTSAAVAGSGPDDFTAFHSFEFRYPPSSDSDEQPSPNETTTYSLSGLGQTSHNFTEIVRDIDFSNLTPSEKSILQQDFYFGWARFGREFRYFPDKDDSRVFVYEIKKKDLPIERQIKRFPDYLYGLSFQFRRVVL